MKSLEQQERPSTPTPYFSFDKLLVNNLHLETFENPAYTSNKVILKPRKLRLAPIRVIGDTFSGLKVKYLGGFIYLAALETPGQVRRIP